MEDLEGWLLSQDEPVTTRLLAVGFAGLCWGPSDTSWGSCFSDDESQPQQSFLMQGSLTAGRRAVLGLSPPRGCSVPITPGQGYLKLESEWTFWVGSLVVCVLRGAEEWGVPCIAGYLAASLASPPKLPVIQSLSQL